MTILLTLLDVYLWGLPYAVMFGFWLIVQQTRELYMMLSRADGREYLTYLLGVVGGTAAWPLGLAYLLYIIAEAVAEAIAVGFSRND